CGHHNRKSPLTSKRSSLKRVVQCRLNTALYVKDFHGNNEKYVWYLLQAFDLSQFASGAGVPTLNRNHVHGELVSTATDLEEQKRIVAVLDAAFEGLTRATEHAEANLQNARELFGAFLEELFLKNSGNWSSANLQDTVTENCTLSYGIVQPGEDVEGGLPVVRPTDLGKPLISRTGLKTISPEKADGYARTRLVGDEILLCVRGTTGVVAKALPDLEGGNVTRGIVPIRFDSRKMLQDFGYYQFRSRHIQEQIEAQTYGAALRQINIRDLRKLSFTFPDLKEQERILPMLQDAQRNCEALIEVNLAKLTDIEDLRQSLLQKAFAGELT
ncbi:MAG: restriction endonuclease subunit S, partial [Litorimonas sp.]